MKFIDSLKQIEGPGGTLENWLMDNGLYLGYWKDETYYHLFLDDINHRAYTKCIFKLLNHPYNNIQMTYGGFMPPKITIEHQYFDKFVSLVEKLSIEDLTPDPFTG